MQAIFVFSVAWSPLTNDWETDQLDAVKAFTQSEVDAEIYVEMLEGFAVEGNVLKLNKALEGIKREHIYDQAQLISQHLLLWRSWLA